MIKKEWIWMNQLNQNKMKLEQLKEQIQEDLLTLTDEYLIDKLDGYEECDTKMCEIIVNNFNRYNNEYQ